MNYVKNVEILGDSVLKGVQVNPLNKRYYTKNDIDVEMLCNRFNYTVKNDSHFGCTVTKGKMLLERMLSKGLNCDALIMDFGGNDCDFKWADISEDPDRHYEPNTPLPVFIEEYRSMIRELKKHGIMPILTTLPPIEPQRFFDWWCGKLNKENVLKWLGSVSTIYEHQENYSKHIEQLAKEENVLLVDLRSAFLKNGSFGEYICEDGTHPNSEGQRIITQAFYDFIEAQRVLKPVY